MSFSYTNTTASGETISPIVLDVVSNYALTEDEPQEARLQNTTASMEQPEIITYKANKIRNVSSDMSVRNPGRVPDGVIYTIKIETIDRDSSGPLPVDEPIVAWLTVKHPASNTWDNAKVASVVTRLISACLKGQASTGSGSVSPSDWRFEDLMRSALKPTTN